MHSTVVYRLVLPRWFLVFAFAILGVLTISVVVGIVTSIGGLAQLAPTLVEALGFAALVAWNWYVALTLPYEVRFEAAETVIFRSAARETRVRLATVKAIEPALFDGWGGRA